MRYGRISIGREAEAARGHVALDHGFKAGLMNGHPASGTGSRS